VQAVCPVNQSSTLHRTVLEELYGSTFTFRPSVYHVTPIHIVDVIFTSPSVGAAKYCDHRVCRFVCLSVCLSARISHKLHVHFTNFSAPVTCSRGSVLLNAVQYVCYVLPVLWMPSCFHIMDRLGRNQRRRLCFVRFARRRHQGRSLPSRLSCLFSEFCSVG